MLGQHGEAILNSIRARQPDIVKQWAVGVSSTFFVPCLLSNLLLRVLVTTILLACKFQTTIWCPEPRQIYPVVHSSDPKNQRPQAGEAYRDCQTCQLARIYNYLGQPQCCLPNNSSIDLDVWSINLECKPCTLVWSPEQSTIKGSLDVMFQPLSKHSKPVSNAYIIMVHFMACWTHLSCFAVMMALWFFASCSRMHSTRFSGCKIFPRWC